MPEAASPLIHRTLWFTSLLFLAFGSLILAFGVGWAGVEAVSAMGSGAAATTDGRDLATLAGGMIVAGVLSFALLKHFESDERTIVQIDFDKPIVGFHGRRLTADRWRVEARISVLARRAFTAVVHDRADDIARAAAEALALLGPRAAHTPDRARAEKALTEMVNRSLRSRVVRSIRIHRVDLAPAL